MRKSSSCWIYKDPIGHARWWWFPKSLDLHPVIEHFIFWKCEKNFDFLELKNFYSVAGIWLWRGLFIGLKRSKGNHWFDWFQKRFFHEFLSNVHSKNGKVLSIPGRILPYFLWFLAVTFSGIDKSLFGFWLVLCLVDNFRVHRFLLKNSSWKSWFPNPY